MKNGIVVLPSRNILIILFSKESALRNEIINNMWHHFTKDESWNASFVFNVLIF